MYIYTEGRLGPLQWCTYSIWWEAVGEGFIDFSQAPAVQRNGKPRGFSFSRGRKSTTRF